MIKLIVATTPNGIIGLENGIPWKIKEDMMFFKETTTGHPLIMGRKTWDSLRRKPLPNRSNIVITRNKSQYNVQEYERTTFVESVQEAVEVCRNVAENGFLIGGEQIYSQALEQSLVDVAIVSHIKQEHPGDAIFPLKLLDGKQKATIKVFDEFEVVEYSLKG